jgi:hypothetical protein
MKTRRSAPALSVSSSDVKYNSMAATAAQQTEQNFLKLLQSRSTKLEEEESTPEETEAKRELLLTKKCIICCTEITNNILSEDEENTSEFINFIGEDCLGILMTKDLLPLPNNYYYSRLSNSRLFCSLHLETLKEALELSKMIKELESKLIEMKAVIRAGAVKCLEEFCSEQGN